MEEERNHSIDSPSPLHLLYLGFFLFINHNKYIGDAVDKIVTLILHLDFSMIIPLKQYSVSF